ncbi:PAS domain S-box protein [Prosthecobacter sp. SYSU 5D2]|uniref:hybrid sensor histidine kinase/response regulator n=1 Tax=Prosthecobacter sp. SYSU 5D2 TaxID=3134134 RepID=UPI0031FF195A
MIPRNPLPLSSGWQSSILDALPAHIALLDRRGIVLAVNESWRRFAADNGMQAQGYGVGMNYLEVSDHACGAHAEEAAETAEGIRRVLSGDLPEFSIEYPCHSPDQRRWFRLTATPLNEQRHRRAVVMHVDVTERRLAENRLKESEERFRATFEQSAVGMAHVAMNGGFLRVNQKLCDITGYSSQEMLGLTFQDLTLPEEQTGSEEARKAMLKGEMPVFSVEKRYRRKDGRLVWVNLVATLAKDVIAEEKYFISVFEDITARKLAEFRLHRMNRLYAVLSKIAEAIVRAEQLQPLYDEACRILVEDGLLKMAMVVHVEGESGSIRTVASYGQKGDYLEGLTITSRDEPMGHGTIGTSIRNGRYNVCNDFSSDPRMAPWRDAALRHGFQATASFPLKTAGETVGALVVFADEAGYFKEDEVRLLVTVAHDLSFAIEALEKEAKRLSAEDARRESEEKFTQLVENMTDVFWITSPEGTLQYVSAAYEQIWGQEAAALYGKVGQWQESILPEDRQRVAVQFASLASDEPKISMEYRITRPDGSMRWIYDRGFQIRDEAGGLVRLAGIATDITERKNLEQQFLRAQRMESIGTLAGGIAHDLNNALTPILMSIELLKLTETDDTRMNVLNTIAKSTQRGADMVKQVLSFARGVEGEQLELDMLPLLKEVEKMCNETFLKNIQVRSEIAADLWQVKGDATQLHQVLVNLCVNARDAMAYGGTLTISGKNVELDEHYAAMHLEATPGRYVQILVEDTGEGMKASVLERIFEPFYTTKELGKGTGLGLSTALAIVKSHGGFMQVQSEPGVGTRFLLHLPAVSSSAQRLPTLDISAPLPRGQGELILVVDDEAAVREITQQTLLAFGYRVLTATDGAEAIAIYAMHKAEVAVVLTDMMMPIMDGPTMIPVLLRMNPGVCIIAASGLNANGMVAKAANAGVKHFIPKPYTAEVLLKTLREVIAKR